MPVISHYVEDPGLDSLLRMVHCVDIACTGGSNTTIDSIGPAGIDSQTSITIGSDGLPMISYIYHLGGGLGELKVAHCIDSTCSTAAIQTLDSQPALPHYPSVTIGVDGLPVISYHFNGDLKVAHCGSIFCLPYFRRR